MPSAYVSSAQVSFSKGDLKQGEALLEEALKRDPTSLPALSMLLKLYVNQGKTQAAVQRLSELIQQNPQNAGLHFLLALAYFNLKDLPKSEASVRQAIALNPNTPEVHTLLANIAFAKRDGEQAKAELRAAIAANSRNIVNYLALCMEYEKEGNWDQAKKICEQAHEVDSAAPIPADALAFLYLDHGGDVNVALALTQQAKQSLPNSPDHLRCARLGVLQTGSPDSAIAQLKDSVEKAPNNPIFQYHLGMAYLASGRRDYAQRSLQAALKDNPNFMYAASARASLEQLNKRLH